MTTSTTKSKTTSRKTTTAKKSTTATTAAPISAGDTKDTDITVPSKLVGAKDLIVAEPDLKKKELIELVVERSMIKKKDAKPVIEAMLAVLGETIASGRELNLQPLGKLRINRSEDKSNGRVIVCKLRQSLPGAGANKDTLAEVADKL